MIFRASFTEGGGVNYEKIGGTRVQVTVGFTQRPTNHDIAVTAA